MLPTMLTLLLTLGTAAADTLDVCPSGCSYQTIQPAVDDAVAGDVVEVGTGTYGAFTILDRTGITVQAADGAQAVLSGEVPASASSGNVIEIRRSTGIELRGFDAVGGNRRIAVIVDSDVVWADMTARDTTLAFNGAGLFVASSTVTIRDSAFENNRATDVARGGHIAGVSGASLSILDTDFTGGSATEGGALWLSGSSAIVEGGTWSGNTAFEGDGPGAGIGAGGAVLATQVSSFTGSSITFMDNTAESDGGHVAAFASTVRLTDVALDVGEASRGGLIYSTVSDVTLVDANLTSGVAEQQGGLVYSSFSTFSATGGSWSDGASQVGGALFLTTAIGDLTDITLSESSAFEADEGDDPNGAGRGGLVASLSSSLTVSGGEWSGGLSGDDGGGGWITGGPATFDGTEFSDNETDDKGGALWITGSSPVSISGALFENNSAGDGGAIHHDSSETLTVSDSAFVENVTDGRGGAIDMTRRRVLDLIDVGFWGNEADSGGALSVRRDGLLSATRTQFCGNLAVDQGGGVRLDGDDVSARFVNSTWADNVASAGGGLWSNSDGGETSLDHVTFRANDATTGSALYLARITTGLSNGIIAEQTTGSAVHTSNGAQARIGYVNWWENLAGNTGGQLSDADLGGTNSYLDPEFQGPIDVTDCERSVWVEYTSPTIDAGSANDSDGDPDDTIPSSAIPVDLGALGGRGASPAPWADVDDDGWPAMWDCDDELATTFPGADELCNGLDDDCDGDVDEDAVDQTVSYADADGDGFGDAETETVACGEVEPGRVEVAGDCNDEEDSIFPGADEICDGLDQDCDDSIDEDALDATRTFFDGDGDDFGDEAIVELACGDPSEGYVLVPGDCDDALDTVYPFAPELCDGISNDCDDAIDEDPVDGQEYLVDEDRDSFGGSDVVIACEPPDNTVDVGGDCDDNNADVRPNADEVCNGIDDNCDDVIDPPGSVGAVEVYSDADGDSFGAIEDPLLLCVVGDNQSTTTGDCDDTQATVFPDADEVCDGLDNNCNGDIDEDVVGLALWYADADLDGYGDPDAPSIESCEQPEGYVLNSDDCDDGNSEVLPLGIERCNGLDNDCNGVIDDGAVDAFEVYPDADGDGQGDANADPVLQCEVSDGVTNNQDCDDSERSVFEGGVEICDGLDNDCDGDIDDDVRFVQWYADQDGDRFGGEAVGDPDCAPPQEGAVETDGDCDDSDASVFPGAEEVVGDGIDQDCDGFDTLEEPTSEREFVPSDDQPDVLATGCDCQTGQAPSGAAWLSLILGGLLIVRRRRAA